MSRDNEIRSRCEAATPGPWVHPEFGFGIDTADRNQNLFYVCGMGGQSHIDADFAAHAREDIPYLQDRVAALEAEREEDQSEIGRLVDKIREHLNEIDQLRAERDAAQRRAEAAEADLNHIAQEMFSDNSDDLRGNWYPCEVCKKYDDGKDCYDCFAAVYDESDPGTAFEWRGPDAAGEGER